MGRAVRIAVGIGLVLVASGASADVICKRKSGAVVVRAACKKKETALDLGQFGVVGPTGQTGETGPMGPAGGFVDSLPSGKTLTGFVVLSGAVAGQRVSNSVSFPIPVSTNILVEVVHDGDAPHLNCPGDFRTPRAGAGYLCIFENTRPVVFGSSSIAPTYGGGHTEKSGISVYADHDGSSTAANFYLSWAVTQP